MKTRQQGRTEALGCLLLLFGLALPATGAEPGGYRFLKQITREKATEEEIVGVTLDADIYHATRGGLPDIRVLDAAGVETSYLIEPVLETKRERVRRTQSIKVVSLDEKADTIEVRLELADKAPLIRGLSLSTPLKDFVRRVQVFGSADGADWTPLVADGRIYDYSRFIDVRQLEIPLPENTFRQFKLVVANVTDEKEFPYKELARTFRGEQEAQRVERTTVERRPLRIDRISGWYEVEQPKSAVPKQRLYPVAPPATTQDTEKKETMVTVTTRREPLTSFTLKTPDRNFHRRAVVKVQTVQRMRQVGETVDRIDWTPVGGADILNFQFRNEHRQQLTITFPEQRQTTYRIVISNEDNPPLSVTDVEASGPVYRVIFLARADTDYRVIYGSSQAAPPRYDAAAVLATLRRDNPVVPAGLGPQLEYGGYTGEPGGPGNLLNNWYFLGAAICLMVIALAWGLFRAGSRLEKIPED